MEQKKDREDDLEAENEIRWFASRWTGYESQRFYKFLLLTWRAGEVNEEEDIRIKMFSHGEIREKNTNGMRE